MSTSDNSTIRTEKTQRELELEEELEEIKAAKEEMDLKMNATEEKIEDLTEKLIQVVQAKAAADDANELLVQENKKMLERMTTVEKRMQEMNAEHKMRIGEMTEKGNKEKEQTSKRMEILEEKINSLLQQQGPSENITPERHRKRLDSRGTPANWRNYQTVNMAPSYGGYQSYYQNPMQPSMMQGLMPSNWQQQQYGMGGNDYTFGQQNPGNFMPGQQQNVYEDGVSSTDAAREQR